MSVAKRLVVLALALVLLVAGLVAWRRNGGTPGEKLDRAIDKTGEKVREAGEAIKQG